MGDIGRPQPSPWDLMFQALCLGVALGLSLFFTQVSTQEPSNSLVGTFHFSLSVIIKI